MRRPVLLVVFAVVLCTTFFSVPARAAESACPAGWQCYDVPQGEQIGSAITGTAKAGIPTVTEKVSDQKIDIFGGVLDSDFTVGQDANAWGPYPSDAAAYKAACTQAQSRSQDAAFKGRSISVNGNTFKDLNDCLSYAPGSKPNDTPNYASQSADCTVADTSTSPMTVLELDKGCLPAGVWVVTRTTDASAGTIAVTAEQLTDQTTFTGPNGQVRVHVWYNYRSRFHAMNDGCREAQDRLSEVQDVNSWDYGYVVTFNGGSVPDDCKVAAAA